MSTIVSRGIDSLALWPPPVRMSRIESLRLGPDVLAPGSLVAFVRWSEPRTSVVCGLTIPTPPSASCGLRVGGDLVLVDLRGDEEEDEREAEPRDQREHAAT